ncbi:MAG: CPBP family intramembrane metalloprotease [Elusimicrobia bacterium]|nr:CPBP family intramembrane metalloprotease [Elusimicrobiota bacterium]
MIFQDLLKPGGDFKKMPVLSLNKWLLVFLGTYLILIGFSLLGLQSPGEHSLLNSRLTALMFYPTVLSLVSLAVLKGLGVGFLAELKDWKSNFKTDALLGILYFCAYLSLIGLLLALGLGHLMEDAKETAAISLLMGKPLLFPVLFLSVVVLAPLGEEIAFKRLLYAGMRREYSVVRAILSCSLLFVLLHSRSAFLPMILFVPVTYYMYERHRRLPANIILHALINLAAIFF